MNKPIKGSCGGLNKLGLKEDCVICGNENINKKKKYKELFYNAIDE